MGRPTDLVCSHWISVCRSVHRSGLFSLDIRLQVVLQIWFLLVGYPSTGRSTDLVFFFSLCVCPQVGPQIYFILLVTYPSTGESTGLVYSSRCVSVYRSVHRSGPFFSLGIRLRVDHRSDFFSLRVPLRVGPQIMNHL